MHSDDDVVPAARLPVGQAPVMSRLRHVVGALKSDARQIFNAGLAAVQPERLISRHLRRFGDTLVIGDRSYPLRSNVHVSELGLFRFACRTRRGASPAVKAVCTLNKIHCYIL